jgi:hypothetical protein
MEDDFAGFLQAFNIADAGDVSLHIQPSAEIEAKDEWRHRLDPCADAGAVDRHISVTSRHAFTPADEAFIRLHFDQCGIESTEAESPIREPIGML